MTTKSWWRAGLAAVAIAGLAAGMAGTVPAMAADDALEHSSTAPDPAGEQYRPYLHFSPERNWMNDPNGLVYEDGTWHLFFQHNPYGTRWGNMSWGHATSTDLVHWEEQPIAIRQGFDDEGRAIEDIFSGSVVSTWSTFEYVATADTARVMAREYGVEAVTRAIAFWMREAAMSSIAFVIFFVVWADLIFCR